MKVFVLTREKLGYHFNSLDSPYTEFEVMGVYRNKKDANDERDRLMETEETKGYDTVDFEVEEQEVE